MRTLAGDVMSGTAPERIVRPADAPAFAQRNTASDWRVHVRDAALLLAAAMLGAAIFLPLWGLTLVSVQYPEGLRIVVYPLRVTGDLREINMLNGYIGMADISTEYFAELRVIALLFGIAAVTCALAVWVRVRWATFVPFALLTGTAAFGLWRMRQRLYEYGHELDPLAPMHIQPFTPPMLGENQIAQFATYSYFAWGTILATTAAVLVTFAVWLDVRAVKHRPRMHEWRMT
jgi:hypothetical protein